MRIIYYSVIAASLLAPLPATAADLKTNSIICLSQAKIDEMVKAVERGDGQWAESIGGCFVTKQSAKLQRLDCSWQTCKVRVWPTSGSNESSVVYVLRQQLR